MGIKWDGLLRMVGVLGLVGAYGVFRFSNGEINALVFSTVITAIIAIVAPEAIDALPLGPSK